MSNADPLDKDILDLIFATRLSTVPPASLLGCEWPWGIALQYSSSVRGVTRVCQSRCFARR